MGRDTTSIRSESLRKEELPPFDGVHAINGKTRWVVFSLDEGRYALALDAVERIVRAAQVTLLPATLPILIGVIDIQGRVLPVLSPRRRFGLPDRPIGPNDHFVIARSAGRSVVLVVDDAQGVLESSEKAEIDSTGIAAHLEYVRGVIRMTDGLVVIHDLDAFLSLQEHCVLDEAMSRDTAPISSERAVASERPGCGSD